MADREYINRWSELVKEYLPKWDKTLRIDLQSKDIDKDINGFIDWLESHENKPNLYNFPYAVLPSRFVDYLGNIFD